MGILCKTYYKLNELNILNCYRDTQEKLLKSPKNSVVEDLDNKTLNNSTTSDEKTEQQDIENFDTNNNKNNNNKNHTHEPSPIEEKKEYATQVQMTEKEYQDLIDTYGEDMAKQLIEQLSLYKQAKGKNYESDYAAILYWVTERLRELEKKDANYTKMYDCNRFLCRFYCYKYTWSFGGTRYYSKGFIWFEIDDLLEILFTQDEDADNDEDRQGEEIPNNEDNKQEILVEFTFGDYYCIFCQNKDKFLLIITKDNYSGLIVLDSINEIFNGTFQRKLSELRLHE